MKIMSEGNKDIFRAYVASQCKPDALLGMDIYDALKVNDDIEYNKLMLEASAGAQSKAKEKRRKTSKVSKSEQQEAVAKGLDASLPGWDELLVKRYATLLNNGKISIGIEDYAKVLNSLGWSTYPRAVGDPRQKYAYDDWHIYRFLTDVNHSPEPGKKRTAFISHNRFSKNQTSSRQVLPAARCGLLDVRFRR